MLLFIEIALTSWAWRQGWKVWALLPGVIVLVLGFIIGASEGAAGYDNGDLLITGIALDILLILTLIVMGACARNPAETAPRPAESLPQVSANRLDVSGSTSNPD